MKNSQNGLPLPNADQEAGNKRGAALVRCLGLLMAPAAPRALWAAGSRRSGHATPRKARQPGL